MMDAMQWLLDVLSPANRAGVPVLMAWVQFLPMIISAAIAALSAARGRRGGGNDGDGESSTAGLPPELWSEIQDMLRMGREEYERQDPLRMSVLQLAYRMMPTFAREGVPGLSLTPISGTGTGAHSTPRTPAGPRAPTNDEIVERARAAGVPLTLDDVIDLRQRQQQTQRERWPRRGPSVPRRPRMPA